MGGFYHGSVNSDSYVVLAGGGYKSVNDFLLSQDHYKTSPGAGTAGTSSATSGSTLAVPYVTVNANGHVTAYGTHTHTISGFLTAQDHYKTSPGAGTAGTSSNTMGSTLAVPYVTVNANGHVTGYGTHTHTISGFATSGHSHTIKIEAASGTPNITLSANTIYKLTSGHSTYLFKTPTDLTGSGGTSVYQYHNQSMSSNTNYRILTSTRTSNGTLENVYSKSACYMNDNGVYFTSDRKMKKDIRMFSLETNIMDCYNPVRRFNWKSNDMPSIGFISQEVEEWCPEAVGISDDGLKTVNYDVALSALCGAMFNRIKELEQTVKELQYQININKR